MAQGELLRGRTFARPLDFCTIFPLREAKRRCSFAARAFYDTSAPASNSADANGATDQRAWNRFSIARVAVDYFVHGAANRDRESRGRVEVLSRARPLRVAA